MTLPFQAEIWRQKKSGEAHLPLQNSHISLFSFLTFPNFVLDLLLIFIILAYDRILEH